MESRKQPPSGPTKSPEDIELMRQMSRMFDEPEETERESATDQFLVHLRSLAHTQLIRFLPAEAREKLNMSADIVRDPGYATEMCVRHNQALVAEKIAAALKKEREGDTTDLIRVAQEIAKCGGFLDEYAVKMLTKHICSKDWEVARACGRHFTDPVQQIVGPIATRADIHVHIPRRGAKKPVFKPYKPAPSAWPYGEVGQEINKDAQRHPDAFAVVEDIVSDPDVMHYGYASAARVRTFARIIKEHRHVRHVFADIFAVTHFNGDPVSPEINNLISFIAHTCSTVCPALLVCRRVGKAIRTPSGTLGIAWDRTMHDLVRDRTKILEADARLPVSSFDQ